MPTAPRSKRFSTWFPLVLACACLMAGCTYQRVVSDSWDQLRQLSAQQGDPQRRRAAAEQAAWAVHVTTLQGRDASEQARDLAKRLREQYQVPDLWIRTSSPEHVMLLRGRYANLDDSQAQSALRQVRLLQLDEHRPFTAARLIQVTGQPRESLDDLDLRQHSGMHSLQIAFFDQDGGPNYRQAAEQYARQLREQGEEAYYYHGPHRSLVTLGLFTDRDFDTEQSDWGNVQVYGPRILQLQQRHPHNLGNGMTIIERYQGQEIGKQPSMLVRVP